MQGVKNDRKQWLNEWIRERGKGVKMGVSRKRERGKGWVGCGIGVAESKWVKMEHMHK